MCNIYEFDSSKLIRDGCTRCMIDCYRDPSVLQFVAISASDAWNNLKKGKQIPAAKNVLDRRNLTSIKAVWEDRNWIGGVEQPSAPYVSRSPTLLSAPSASS